MYDHHHERNGRPSLAPPSPWEILFGMVHRIENRQIEQGSRLGGLESGQRIALENDREIFGQIREVRDRVSRVEGSFKHLRAATSSETAPPSAARSSRTERLTAFLEALRAVLPSLVWLSTLAVVAVLAIKGVIAPEDARAWLGLSGIPK